MLTPLGMIQLGVFGGSYFGAAQEQDFEGLSPELEAAARTQVGNFKRKVNQYQVKAGLSFEEWTRFGWIFPEDPLGWFHWYCRYESGRRHHRDDHQLARAAAYLDRWSLRARIQIAERGFCSLVIRQGLLQWGHKPAAHGLE